MRRLKNGLLVALTLLLVTAGAVMPEAVSYLQDIYGANLEERFAFDSFSLTLRQESDLGGTPPSTTWTRTPTRWPTP